MAMLGGGSSPRVRGKPPTVGGTGPRRRLIPARAGKTTTPAGKPASSAAHPRACGENPPGTGRPRSPVGSSPRVRGKLEALPAFPDEHGLIPARAGKTVCPFGVGVGVGAHPRACGENDGRTLTGVAVPGSSPRVRGKLRLFEVIGGRRGLIPARAGKTMSWSIMIRGSSAHPRACGENLELGVEGVEVGGSSPRVRGKPVVTMGTSAEMTAHPRACGENVSAKQEEPGDGGSSPRVRGKLLPLPTPLACVGLIPARAGKTTSAPPTAVGVSAHPRACGENSA